MSVVVTDLNSTSLNKSKIFDISEEAKGRILSLSEYIKIAKKTIAHFASSSLASSMLKNEDAISFIAECLMKGSIRWKEDGGRELHSYLNQCAIWGIKRWVTNQKSANRYSGLSLDYILDESEGNSLYALLEDKKQRKEPDLSIDEIINKPYLNDTQKECLRLRFVDGMTLRAIGKTLNKSSQRIEQIVNKALGKLRKEYEQNKTF